MLRSQFCGAFGDIMEAAYFAQARDARKRDVFATWFGFLPGAKGARAAARAWRTQPTVVEPFAFDDTAVGDMRTGEFVSVFDVAPGPLPRYSWPSAVLPNNVAKSSDSPSGDEVPAAVFRRDAAGPGDISSGSEAPAAVLQHEAAEFDGNCSDDDMPVLVAFPGWQVNAFCVRLPPSARVTGHSRLQSSVGSVSIAQEQHW